MLEDDKSDGIAALAARAKPSPPAHWAKQVHANVAGARTPRRPTPGEDDPGHLNVAWPILIPSELRRHFSSTCNAVNVDVKVQGGKRRHPRTPFYFAANAAQRQQRRKTWNWRCAYNQLPEDARVDIAIHGGQRLTVLLGEHSQALAA